MPPKSKDDTFNDLLKKAGKRIDSGIRSLNKWYDALKEPNRFFTFLSLIIVVLLIFSSPWHFAVLIALGFLRLYPELF